MWPGEYKIVADRLHEILSKAPGPRAKPQYAPPAGDIRGLWEAELRFKAGSARHTFYLDPKGNKLSGQYTGRLMKGPLTGHIDGTKVEFSSGGRIEGTIAALHLQGNVRRITHVWLRRPWRVRHGKFFGHAKSLSLYAPASLTFCCAPRVRWSSGRTQFWKDPSGSTQCRGSAIAADHPRPIFRTFSFRLMKRRREPTASKTARRGLASGLGARRGRAVEPLSGPASLIRVDWFWHGLVHWFHLFLRVTQRTRESRLWPYCFGPPETRCAVHGTESCCSLSPCWRLRLFP